MDGNHEAGLHVEDAGTGGAAVGDRERAGRQRSQREDRVVMPDKQDAGSPPPRHTTCGPAGPSTSSAAVPRRRPINSARAAADAVSAATSCEGDSISTRLRRSSSSWDNTSPDTSATVLGCEDRRFPESTAPRCVLDLWSWATTRRACRAGDVPARARREAVSPEQVSLPRGLGRRTPGLRREEVALLAGVSVTWYTWLEQGRRINASDDVLRAIGRALRLDPAGQDHLVSLAHPVSANGSDPFTPEDVPTALRRFIDGFEPAPAYVLGPHWEFGAWNAARAGCTRRWSGSRDSSAT